jgi:uncharacterized protein YcbX
MVMIVHVRQLWRYPVKSMGGQALEACEVLPTGLEGDRRWGVVDVKTGRVLTARREPRLLFANACLRGREEVEITLPDGRVATDSDTLSAWLGRPVTLQRAGTTGGVYENPRDFEKESDWVVWQGPGEAWHDSATVRVSLLSEQSVGSWDVRRFRPNVLIDGKGEDHLLGSVVKIGAVELDVVAPIRRCIMVTRAQPGLPADLDVLRQINSQRGTLTAVGALVRSPGRIAVGDDVMTVTGPRR